MTTDHVPSGSDGSSRVVVVLGGSSGIGRATAMRLCARGDDVVLASRSLSALEAAQSDIAAQGRRPSVVECDVRDRAAVERLVKTVLSSHGRIDAVVQSAGVVAYGRFEDVPPATFDAVIETNLLGAANVAREVLPVFRRQESGTLALIGSVIGDIAAPNMSAYAVSKAGLRSLGRHLAIENRDLPDVRVSVISPGSVDTPIYGQAANYVVRPGRPPPPVASAGRAADAVVRALDHPRDRISVGRTNWIMRTGFTVLPAAFDALVGPMFSVLAMGPDRQPATEGNVIEPMAEREAVDGGYRQGIGDVVRSLRGVISSGLGGLG